MRRFNAWMCIAGGSLWALKAVYDWLALDRVVNRGYPPSDVTDYIEFIIPLLCLGGIVSIYTRLGKQAVVASWTLGTGLGLIAMYHLSETYAAALVIGAGLLFLLPGTILQWAGAALLFNLLTRHVQAPLVFRWWSAALFAVNSCFCVLPIGYGVIADRLETPVTVGTVMAVGTVWASLGAVFLRYGEWRGARQRLRSEAERIRREVSYGKERTRLPYLAASFFGLVIITKK